MDNRPPPLPLYLSRQPIARTLTACVLTVAGQHFSVRENPVPEARDVTAPLAALGHSNKKLMLQFHFPILMLEREHVAIYDAEAEAGVDALAVNVFGINK